jgi:hypothetical protein
MDTVLTVTVTDYDIDSGVPGSFTQCPVAIAIRRTLAASHVSVGENVIQVSHGYRDSATSVNYATPADVRDFVRWFDGRGAAGVEPFSFDLERVALLQDRV